MWPALIAAAQSKKQSEDDKSADGAGQGANGGDGFTAGNASDYDHGVTAFLTNIDDEREQKATDKQNAAIAARNMSRSVDEAAAYNALQGEMMGPSGTEFVSSDLAIQDDVAGLGGDAFRQNLMQGLGVDPKDQFNPYIQGFDQYAKPQAQQQHWAEGVADSSIADWESAQRDTAAAYDADMAAVAEERERRKVAFESEVAGLDESRLADDAEMIIQRWVDSERATGADKEFQKEGAFGRNKGSDNTAKQALVDRYLDAGYSYSQIMAELEDYLSGNRDTKNEYRTWDGGE